jgi:hypothetical protein
MSDSSAAPPDLPEPTSTIPEPSTAVPEPAAVGAPPRPWRAAALVLAGALALVVALVATAPLWAPLLPWGPASDGSRALDLTARLDQIEQRQRAADRDAANTTAALQRIETRLTAPTTSADGAATDLRRQLAALSASVAALGIRFDAVQKALPAGNIAAVPERLAKLSGAVTDLGRRQDALDKVQQGEAARGAAAAALALAILQIRDAIAAGRPFATPYETLAALAHSRPEIAKAAQPLADAANTGVLTRAALASELSRLTADTATEKPSPTAASSWTRAILAQLSGLVRIQRVDETGAASGPAAEIVAAQQRLAGGDLAGAASALDNLSGAASTAVAPWLHDARRRLAVEAALQRVEAAAASGLSAAALAAPPVGAGSPQ